MVQLFVTFFENGIHFQLQLEKKRRRPNLNVMDADPSMLGKQAGMLPQG